jgi:hypothetical protein
LRQPSHVAVAVAVNVNDHVNASLTQEDDPITPLNERHCD